MPYLEIDQDEISLITIWDSDIWYIESMQLTLNMIFQISNIGYPRQTPSSFGIIINQTLFSEIQQQLRR
jgi:hypothetical protein